ncbi:MAG: sensor histidine kinase, partial [Halocynthiibacter sp.]
MADSRGKKNQVTQELVSAVPMALILIGADGRIEMLNPAARALLGNRLPGLHYVAGLRQPALQEAIEAVLQGGAARKTRFQSRQAGRETLYRVGCAPVSLEGGRGVLVSFDDVSELEEAGQMRRDFVANVSHELRTPLTALLGFIETLRGPARDDAAARARFLTIMEREAVRMNRLVQDLLSLSRVEADERLRPTSALDIADPVRAAIEALRPHAEDCGVALRLQAAGDPCEVIGACEVIGDRDQLQQVFTNLIENALKYGGGAGDVIIEIGAVQPNPELRGHAVTVSVSDSGDGIDARHIPRLTERFYRVDAHRSRKQGGTGLGLAIVKHIVSRHRGRLRIDSTPGQGS